jgi:hypothetical protein
MFKTCPAVEKVIKLFFFFVNDASGKQANRQRLSLPVKPQPRISD